MLRNRKLIVFVVCVLLLVAVLPALALAQEPTPTPGDPTTWPPLDQVLGGAFNDIMTALAPVLAAPLTVAGIALVKFVLARWYETDTRKVSGEAIAIIVALLVYGGWLFSQYFGYGEQFVSASAILAVAFEGLRSVLVLLFGQQVLYLGARRLNVPGFGYTRSLPDGAKKAA